MIALTYLNTILHQVKKTSGSHDEATTLAMKEVSKKIVSLAAPSIIDNIFFKDIGDEPEIVTRKASTKQYSLIHTF